MHAAFGGFSFLPVGGQIVDRSAGNILGSGNIGHISRRFGIGISDGICFPFVKEFGKIFAVVVIIS